MYSKLRTRRNTTPAPNFSTAPARGMLQSRRFTVPQQTDASQQQPDLKTSLMQRERYGHHLSQMPFADASAPTTAQPNQMRQPMHSEGAEAPSVQALTVGAPDHRHKQEADPMPAPPMPTPELTDPREEHRRHQQSLPPQHVQHPQVVPHTEQAQEPDTAASLRLNQQSAATEQSQMQEVAQAQKYNPAAKNKKKGLGTTLAQVGATGVNTAGQHSHLVTHSANLISSTVGGAIALPLSVIGAGRSTRQAEKARKRSQIAHNYAKKYGTESSDEGQHINHDDKKLAEVAHYMAQKQGNRHKKLAFSASATGLSAGFGAAALATAAVPPVGAALGITSGVLGGVGALPSVGGVAKAGYKKIRGTKGKNRTAKASELHSLAKGGHEGALDFMRDTGILNQGARPNPEAKGFYGEDLQDENKEKVILKYVKQKMRS